MSLFEIITEEEEEASEEQEQETLRMERKLKEEEWIPILLDWSGYEFPPKRPDAKATALGLEQVEDSIVELELSDCELHPVLDRVKSQAEFDQPTLSDKRPEDLAFVFLYAEDRLRRWELRRRR